MKKDPYRLPELALSFFMFAIIVLFVAAILRADEPPAAAPVVAATLRADGTTNTWTQADLSAALGLLNRKYWRDMETLAGRREWHGALVKQTVATNDAGRLVKTELYADGFTFAVTGRTAQAAGRVALVATEADALRARIATLEAAGTAAAARSAALLRRRLARIEAAAVTNVVDAVITPEGVR